MKTTAAVAREAGRPLTIEQIDLGASEAGEMVLLPVATGVGHTDACRASGADPEGLFPVVLGREGGVRCGSTFGGVKGRSRPPGCGDRCMQDEFKVDEFVSMELPPSRMNEAFDRLHEGKAIRTVLHYGDFREA